MKFNKNLVALSLAGLFTAGANASTLTAATPFTVPLENVLAANYTVDLDALVNTPNGNALGQTIYWEPSFGLNTGDVITFTFTNGLYMDGDVKLIGEEALAQQPTVNAAIDIDNDGDTDDVVEVATNFGAVDTVNGVSTVSVRINNGLILPTGIRLVIQASAGSAEQDDDGTIDDTQNDIRLRIPQGTAAGNVSIESSGITSGNVNIPAAKAGPVTVLDIERQINVSVDTAATSTIEINATAQSRTFFVDETGGGDVVTNAGDTDLSQSAALIEFDNDGDSSVEDFFTTNANDDMTVTVTGTNLNNLDTTAGAQFIELAPAGNGTANNTDFDLVIGTSDLTVTIPDLATNFPARGNTVTDDLVLDVDGTVLSDRSFSTAFSVDYDNARPEPLQDYSVSAANSHSWALSGGGAILHTPLASMNPNFNHRVTLTNRSLTDANYRVSAVGEDGCTVTLASGFTDGSAVLPGDASTSVMVSDIVTGVTCTTGNPNRVGLTFDIEASTQDIQGIIQLVNVAAGDVVTSNYLVRNGTN